ncbi:glycosyltransferase [Synoicihabitans lomoniglobus]|uniref:Glycosyltransferase n=1 Tax=Synoicihabitans lomoniglobus TaxID=2909285 RepID=A0AAF0CSR8_9BACT|nr:glycosyltransferase [Opitutaceae bacterium LMO-M01]WED67397.1 glycosyltransferase [Opitutaceae bacterium LMO-M01]
MQVSFIIPVFNQLAHTQACLASLREHVPVEIEHEIILVDDASDAETRSFLASLSAPVRVQHNESNQGFARSTNRGAAVATGTWLCLLNNDVALTTGAIATMLAVPTSHPDAGIIGNIQITTDTGDVDHAGIDFVDGGYPLHRRGALADLQAQGDVVAVPAVTAACCLVNRAWFTALSGLDERYRNGFEDVDLCLRARENGWGIYVATQSVVRHAVSLSEGRGRHEFRNAQKFLDRWGPRTAAIEKAEREAAARRWRMARAQAATGGPPAVVAARRAQLEGEQIRMARAASSAVVWVDLLRMESGGANGGIKPFLFSFLRELVQLRWEPQTYVLLIRPGLAHELQFLRSTDALAIQSPDGWRLQTNGDGAIPHSLAEIEKAFPPEVLYCPFTTSSFARPGLPMVTLIVDALHRDLPSALPIEEVNFREDGFKRAIGAATWVQTLAQHGIDRLQEHYDVHPARCFHTYAPVHQRLEGATDASERPSEIPAGPFFFYPANFWPHKNHEVVLTAYQLYRHKAGTDAWPLVLTGHPDARMTTLRAMSAALGLDQHVHFLGHLPTPAFAALWQHAGALVFPSLHEGFGIPLLEAFEKKLPVLAAETSVLPEVGGDACAWFDPRSPHALADAMTVLAEDSDRRATLVELGTKRLKKFSLHFEACRLNHFLHAAARGLVP